MWDIIIIMSLGVLVGYLIREKRFIISKVVRVISIAIYLLLFILGVAIGGDNQIVSNLSELGAIALLITISAIFGSLIFSWLLYKFIFSKSDEE